MKIGLTGAQGTGKTSVAREFARQFNYATVGSMARAAAESGLGINKTARPLDQLLTTITRINSENLAVRQFGNVLSERTVLDHLAYTKYLKANVWPVNDLDGNAVTMHTLPLVIDHMETYDLVVYFPVFWAPKAEKHRDGDVEYQRAVDWQMKNLLDTLSIDYVTMKNESVNKRVETIARLVKD